MKFEEWFDINPKKDTILQYDLSLKEQKILTPILLNSGFLISAKPFYDELCKKLKKNTVPDFLVQQYAINYKRRFITAFPYYALEKELKALIKVIPSATVLLDSVEMKPYYKEILKKDLQFFDVPLERGYNERVKILHEGRLVGWKFKQVSY